MVQEQPLDWRGKTRSGVVTTVVGSAPCLDSNSRRKVVTVVNRSVNLVYLCKEAVGNLGFGIPLYPTYGYEFNETNMWYGPLSIVCAAAGGLVTWTEDE